MYEKLDKLREEVRRCERRLADAQNKLKTAQEKLREGEASQILSDVGALKLTPEQLAQVLSLVKSGQMGQVPGIGVESAEEQTPAADRSTLEELGHQDDQDNVGASDWDEDARDEELAFDEEV